MYAPPAFRETRIDVLHGLIRSHPLGTLITAANGPIKVSLLPFALAVDEKLGVLRAHLAKANGQIEDLRSGAEALVLFQGPQAYVSPSWYQSKREGQEAVPTWNYVAVEARGVPRIVEEAAWLHAHLETLTNVHEEEREGRWHIADAPADYLAAQFKGIVGLEIPIARIEGKWKVSQNRSPADREGVAAGLRADGAWQAAELVEKQQG